MVNLNLKSLISKLNTTCHRSLEAAAGLCLSRTNYNVEIEHWLMKLLDEPNTDIAAVLHHHGVDHATLLADLTKSIDRFKTGNARPPALAPNVVDLARESWVLASVEFGAQVARSGHLLAALLMDQNLSRVAADISDEFEKIPAAGLLDALPTLTSDTAETADSGAMAAAPARGGAPAGEPGAPRPGGPSKTPSLDQYTTDLTAAAKAGKIDPVLGRDDEIRQIIDILTRRRQNNPILTGEAGVGKTAVVEGFALRVAADDVPDILKGVTIKSLDLALLEAGAGVKGEFENRLKSVINEVKASPSPIIMFIDEAHTLIGAGGQAGQGDAANLLKPALARGELRTIAATTWAEYKKFFEKDPALTRRFQVVKVEEPTEAVCTEMIRGVADVLEKHHGVRVLDEAVADAVKLSHRYITGRQLPDKAVSLLDTACARVAIGQSSTPAAIEDASRRLKQIDVEIGVLEREALSGAEHVDRLGDLQQEKEQTEARLAALNERWKTEGDLVRQSIELRNRLEGRVVKPKAAAKPAPEAAADKKGKAAAKGSAQTAPEATAEISHEPLPDSERTKLQSELAAITTQLSELQGEQPLMSVCVDSQSVADVVSNWTGIPVGRMVSNEIRTVLDLKKLMEERIVGQSHALEVIAQSIRSSRAKLTDPRRPVGVFMLAGPSGVGKTETAIVLSDLLFGGEQNMTTINMSEFKEEHKVSLLMGSPPGYVGYGEGGVLTEAVRRRPYSVVLLDELEKAHEGVQEIFYQVFDKGILRDGEGRDIDFKNTVIIMTSNAGTDLVMKLCADPETRPDPADFATALHEELLKTFKPAFLGRINIIPYYPLTDDVLKKIIGLKLGSVSRRVRDNYRAEFEYTPAVVETILGRCKEVESGARNVDHILSHTVLPQMSSEFLGRMADGLPISQVLIDVDKEQAFKYQIS